MDPGIRYRPMRHEDVEAVHHLAFEAFSDLDRRLGQEYHGPAPRLEQSAVRYGRLLASDPDGCLVAERDGAVVGCSVGILRDGLWGLSMLVVDPSAQGGGVGRELLRRAHEYGAGARGRMILSSEDPRALRAYARLGLTLHPCVIANGTVRRPPRADGLREGGREDLPLAAEVDRAVRGAAHGEDVMALVASGGTLLVAPGRGYVVVREGRLMLLAAFDEDAARELLRGALARSAADGHDAMVEWISAAQAWAVDVCLDAGLELLARSGAVFLGGDLGPFRPYLPSGAYL